MLRSTLLLFFVVSACDDGGGGSTVADAGAATDAELDDLDVGSADALPDDARVLRDLRLPDDGGLEPDGPPGIRHVWVGVNEMAEDLLGFEPSEDGEFHWRLPPAGWTVNVVVEHGPEWSPTELPYVLWRFVSAEGEPIPLDASTLEPAGGVWEPIPKGHRWRARVVEPIVAEPGIYTLETAVEGNVSRKLRFEIIEPTPEALPFDEGVDHWAVTFDRDGGRVQVTAEGDTFQVKTTAEPDGVPDFVEALDALALLGGDDAWDAAVIAQVRARIREHLRAFFQLDAPGDDPVPIAFHFDDDPELPPREEWAAMGWSAIAVGGEDPRWEPGGRTFFGRADLDWHNVEANDNTRPDRGIFTTGLARFVLDNMFTRTLLRDYLEVAGGQPFGSLPSDAAFLDPEFDPESLPAGSEQTRALRYRLLFDSLTLALGSIIAHEIGHSLGLVKPGLPPHGLLAGVRGPWETRPATDAHIDTPGFNLMQTGSSFDFADALNAAPAFNGANMAYLRGRLVVVPGP